MVRSWQTFKSGDGLRLTVASTFASFVRPVLYENDATTSANWHLSYLATLIVVGLVLVPHAQAAPWKKCSSDRVEPNARVAACTGLLKHITDPSFSDIRALVFSNRGSALTDLHEIARAIADFDAALALQPDLAEAFNGRCWARAVVGQGLDDALRDCDQAVKLEPGSADGFDSRGFVYLRLGKNDRAIADYTAALAIRPNEASSLYGRGLARAFAGQKNAAKTDFAAAKAIDATIGDQFAAMGVLPRNPPKYRKPIAQIVGSP